jgi:hypothetical protein
MLLPLWVSASHCPPNNSTKFVDGDVWVDTARIQNAAGKIWLQQTNYILDCYCIRSAPFKLDEENAQIGYNLMSSSLFHDWLVLLQLVMVYLISLLFSVALYDYC